LTNRLQVEVYQQDALEFLATVPNDSVDVIITDPPYWTLDRWRNIGTTTRLGGHRNKARQRDEMWFSTVDRDYLWRTFLELDRVLRLDGHLYIFCDDQISYILQGWLMEARDEHRFGGCHLLVWDKETPGMGYHYRRRYEFIVFAWREKRSEKEGGYVPGFRPRRLANLGTPDILTAKRIVGGYPTEKPPALVQTLIMQSARVGNTLLDPFAGSGVLAAACPFSLGCRILLNDVSPAAIAWMKRRFAGGAIPVRWPRGAAPSEN